MSNTRIGADRICKMRALYHRAISHRFDGIRHQTMLIWKGEGRAKAVDLDSKHFFPGKWIRAHFGQSIFSFFQQKRKKDILLILVIFTYFKVQTKIEEKKLVRKIDHFFIFLILKSASRIQKIL